MLQGTERYFRDGVPSVAGTAKAFPGTLSNNPTYFFGWDLDVMPGSVISVTTTAGSAAQSFFSAGSTLVDPLDLSVGYLGDAGFSGPDVTFSIDAPAGGTFWLIASSVGGTGAIGFLAEAQVTYTPGVQRVPEPASLALLGLGLTGLAALHRRRQ